MTIKYQIELAMPYYWTRAGTWTGPNAKQDAIDSAALRKDCAVRVIEVDGILRRPVWRNDIERVRPKKGGA